jgi:hypothetical protein
MNVFRDTWTDPREATKGIRHWETAATRRIGGRSVGHEEVLP